MKFSTSLLPIITGAAALVVPRSVTRVSSIEQLETIIKTTPKVSTNFCAEWSGACKIMEEQYRSLSNKDNRITFVYVNIDSVGAQEASDKYDFNAIPTFITFKDGKEFGNRVIGPANNALDRQIATLANN